MLAKKININWHGVKGSKLNWIELYGTNHVRCCAWLDYLWYLLLLNEIWFLWCFCVVFHYFIYFYRMRREKSTIIKCLIFFHRKINVKWMKRRMIHCATVIIDIIHMIPSLLLLLSASIGRHFDAFALKFFFLHSASFSQCSVCVLIEGFHLTIMCQKCEILIMIGN